ncbi:unnamed protein product [Cylindrotheca closterium]|nr:unnamed protein product [Cylindrotheca closterium]
MTPEPQVAVPKGVEEKNGEKSVTASQLRVLHRSSEVNSVTTLQTPQDSNEKKNADGSIRPNEAATNEGSVRPVESAKARDQNNKTSSIVQVSTRQSRGRQRSSRRKHPTDKAKQRWCLNDEQMELCYTSCMSHYEDVMRTVKARDLARELADGFDVLRERGRGRFDMELPAFDTEAFSFLIDLQKAPWMPIVKCILGEEVSLIHKGCFLSLPDAETQVYHQDGVHLNSQTQKPCHAINVFVPLVDLTPRNGPTEFCLGSHILGNEGFDKDFVEIPKPTAGTPVIFDYRLGHRGLGNSSSKCRPIVYCTYARGAVDGKEFRDSVNFSKRRYHKIGELTQKPLSREERRLNRKRSLESRQIKAEAKKIAKLEQQQTLAKGKENEVEKQNFVKSSVVSRPQNFDFPTDQNEWQANVAIEKIYSSEGKKTAEPCHLPPPVTTGDNQSD